MKLSINFLKDYVELDEDVDVKRLAEDMTNAGNEYDEAGNLINATKLVIGEIVECEDHPDSDHLHCCKVNVGSEVLDIVCGAPNVRKGMLAVWLQPGCIVPQTYGGENFELGVRKMRGYESNGMLAGLDEIDLGDDHSGIVEIDPNFAKAGDDFAGRGRKGSQD